MWTPIKICHDMKVIALTDLHGRTAIFSILKQQLQEADLIILCGDITHFGHEAEAASVIGALRTINPSVLAVSGNCDNAGVEKHLILENISLFGTIRVTGGISFVGLGGSLPCPGPTPHEYSEEEYDGILRGIGLTLGLPFILVSHQPPFNTLNDKVSPGNHVGSRTLRRFIERTKPLICFTGHIHEGIGMDHIGSTVVVNPGPAFTGGYTVAEIEEGQVKDIGIRKATI